MPRIERRVRQNEPALPWAALVDEELVQAGTREEAVSMGGVLMRKVTAMCRDEFWQVTYIGFAQ